MKELLVHSDGDNHCETRRIAQRKQDTLDLHIGQLTRMRRRLKTLIERSLKADGKGTCPIIEALVKGE